MSMTATSDPPFSNLGRRSNKITDPLAKGYFNFLPGECWTPCVNLYETEQAYLVCVDLAGVDKEKIDVEVVDNQLTLKGDRVVPCAPDLLPCDDPSIRKPRVHLMEIDHGAFSRTVELPVDVNRDQITAQYLNGMLWIEIPKS
jgi:HSP20 family protein